MAWFAMVMLTLALLAAANVATAVPFVRKQTNN